MFIPTWMIVLLLIIFVPFVAEIAAFAIGAALGLIFWLAIAAGIYWMFFT